MKIKFLFFWLVAWILVSIFLYSNAVKQSKNGFITRQDCVLQKRLLPHNCSVYSHEYKVPIILEAEMEIVGAGIITGALLIVYIYSQLLLKKFEKR